MKFVVYEVKLVNAYFSVILYMNERIFISVCYLL